MTDTPQHEDRAPATPLPAGSFPCPRCGEVLSPAQDWCLNCGDPARTVIAPTPRWRLPVAVLASLAAIALGVLVAAFIGLSSDDPPPSVFSTQTITTQPGSPPIPGVATTPVPTTPVSTASTAPSPQSTSTTPSVQPTTGTTGTGGALAPPVGATK